MIKVLNFCNYNFGRFGSQAYKYYLDDPRVVVDQSPQCMDHCYECLQSPIALVGDIIDPTNVSLDIWLLLQGKTPADLIKNIERGLK